ncbi:unnamed protein product [Durusdinium trenchii]|uniref:Nicotinamide-nucleotide adenylyltransferase n=1 Tax=Durusdinium trenchii TaxID=1381693 RepID=A0ABP0M0S9_9DINO
MRSARETTSPRGCPGRKLRWHAFAVAFGMLPAFAAVRQAFMRVFHRQGVCTLPSSKLRLQVPEGRIPVAIVAPGSFSPPTLLHLRMFEEARDALERTGGKFKVVGGYMSPVHDAYGKASLAPAHHRLSMVEAAVSDSDWIMADSWECLCRSEWTPTVEVVSRFAAELSKVPVAVGSNRPQCGKVQLVMLCGGDVLQSFNATKPSGERVWPDDDVEVIVGQHGLVCVGRGKADLGAIARESTVLGKHLDKIVLAKPRVLTGISSSVVRQYLASNQSIRYLVHDKVSRGLFTPGLVRDYIFKHKLNELPNWQ